jgi:phosphoribosylanthranilate isomerase
MIKVKVCGLRDPLNVREIAGYGPDYMGFIFYPRSKRFVGENPGETVFREVKAGILKVGVFVDDSFGNIQEQCSRYSLNLVQLHGTESAQYCAYIKSMGLRVIKAFGVDNQFAFGTLVPYLKCCDYFLFDTKSEQHGGTGLKFNWEKLKEYAFKIPFFLGGGVGPGDVAAIGTISHPAFYAVDINSRFETEPGLKNNEQVRAFIQEIKSVNL